MHQGAILAIQSAADAGVLRNMNVKQGIKDILESPAEHLRDPHFGPLAKAVLEAGGSRRCASRSPIAPGAKAESSRNRTCRCGRPARCRWRPAAALMPDAHVGYGLPIGGVLALDNAVVPYAVGVDIACRMKLSVLDMPAWTLTDRLKFDLFERAHRKRHALRRRRGSREAARPCGDGPHWCVTRVTRENKDKAWKQLGTSGSGNHFVEFGLLTLDAGRTPSLAWKPASTSRCSATAAAAAPARRSARPTAPLPAPGCRRNTNRWAGWPGWIMDSEAGQEYWAAMNLMGEYAAANHDVIHRLVSKLLGAKIIAGVENHHNFAWKEIARRPRGDRPSQGRDAGRPGRAGRDSRLDGRPGVRRPRQGHRRKLELGLARRRPADVAHAGEAEIHLAGGAKESGERAACMSFRPGPTKCRAFTRTSRT